jgi:hypothetical protein
MADALSIISLEQAKEFLVIDFPDRDEEITRNIKSAISYIERYTNVMTYEREKSYTLTGCSLEIYDAPISLITTVSMVKHNVLSITVFGKSGDTVLATVGHNNIDDIPEDLISAAYILISYLTENKNLYPAELPWDIQVLINMYRRSATI